MTLRPEDMHREAHRAAPENEPVWYYLDSNGVTTGPTSLGFLRRAISAGASPQTLVWSPSTPGWVPASQVPALASAVPAPPRPSEGGFLMGYFLWPIVLIQEVVKVSRRLEERDALTRRQYFDATVVACVPAMVLLLAAGGFAISSPPGGDDRGDIASAISLALLAIILPAMFMVRATVGRLRALGENERRSLLMLVPGVNLLLWAHLMKEEGAVDQAHESPRTPVVPPPDRQRRLP